MTQEHGYLAIVLHAHLPYVRHPEYPQLLEERWLYEAITETYLPLLQVFRNLRKEGVPFGIAMSITPTLCSMLSDGLLRRRYEQYLDSQISLAEKEVLRTRFDQRLNRVSEFYFARLRDMRQVWKEIDGNLTAALGDLQDSGDVEIMASAATHGFLPLLAVSGGIDDQVRIGIESYIKTFGRQPVGFWLPECGYDLGIETSLQTCGTKYTILDTHGIMQASPTPKSVYAPISFNGVNFFGRDPESSRQVWSKTEGYPGDFDYREFYRDIGYDLDWDYLAPHLPDKVRIDTGFKYYRITGVGEDKEPYNRDNAIVKAGVHAGNFVFNRSKQIEYLSCQMDRPPIVLAPYDAELFGHWWYEGPEWLDAVLRKTPVGTPTMTTVSPGTYLALSPADHVAVPHPSSWGLGGYNEVWLNETNDWIYLHLHAAADEMANLKQNYSTSSGLIGRALNQAMRELLLAQASDWPFIMKSGTTVQYATKRIVDHLTRFQQLAKQIRANQVDEEWLTRIEQTDNLFSQFGDFGLVKTG